MGRKHIIPYSLYRAEGYVSANLARKVTGFSEEDLLQLSGIRHDAFCPRQWGLIHPEGLWNENRLTAEGALMRERAHDEQAGEKRGDLLAVRGMRVFSATLGVSGARDVVEFHQCEDGVPLIGRVGRWSVCPVEYKHGQSKETDADRVQVCAQAMCREEMSGCVIPQGALFYQQTRRREERFGRIATYIRFRP